MKFVTSISINMDKKDVWEKFKEIARRENKPISDLMTDMFVDYVKKHGEGNPVYPLDKWQDPNFKAIPALASDFGTWFNFIKKCDSEERGEIKQLVIRLDNALSKAWRLPIETN